MGRRRNRTAVRRLSTTYALRDRFFSHGSLLTRADRFWLRIPPTATEVFRRRFLATWTDYIGSVVKQAEHRSESRILDLEDYLVIRRHTSGAPSTIAFCEMHSEMPDNIRDNPIIREMETLAVDLIVIANVSTHVDIFAKRWGLDPYCLCRTSYRITKSKLSEMTSTTSSLSS